MRRKLRSYQAFTRVSYRLLVCLIPVLAVATGCMAGGGNYIIQLSVAVNTVLVMEIMADFWVFGGLSSAGNRLPEYLKTSKNGMLLLKDAAEVQFVRIFLAHLLSAAAYALGWGILFEETSGQSFFILAIEMAGLGFLCTALGIYVGRYFTTLYAQAMVATAAALLFVALLVSIALPVWLVLICLFAAVIFVYRITIRAVTKTEKGGYYDKED